MAYFPQFFVSFATIYLSLLFQNGSPCTFEPIVPYIGDNLQIKYKAVENNYNGDTVSLIEMNFTNSGSQSIGNGNWAIYFHHIRMIERQKISPNGTMLGNSGLRVHHYNGVLFWLEPTAEFLGLSPGQTLKIQFIASDWTVSRTDIMPNWYVVSRGQDCNDIRLILSTVGESLNFVSSFETSKQWKRLTKDLYDPLTPEARYSSDYVADSGVPVRKIIPTPLSESYTGETVNLKMASFVVITPDDQSIHNEATFLAEKLGLNQVPSSVAPGKNIIVLQIGTVPDTPSSPEAYQIQINSTHVTVTGNSPSGVFYAVQSLLSLAETQEEGLVFIGTIRDSPRFGYRGMHVDTARNFRKVDEIERLLDAMAMYKLNRLHFHLGDDEGWRLEIPGIPELTDIGSRRCHDLTGNLCIMPQLGSIPTQPNLGSGYYTIDEYKSLLSYANDRHIVVVPEFDMPGHGHAPVNAMLARYRRYIPTNDTRATEYLLTDLEDESVYSSVQEFTDNAINPCVNSTYAFVAKVLDEVKKMHQGIQPLVLYHIGGDEVAKDAWLKSPACLNQFGANFTQAQVKRYFIQRINETVYSAGVTPVAWEDGITLGGKILNRTDLFAGDAWAQSWDNIWEWGAGGRAYTFANAGYKVMLSHATHLNFDFPAEPDPEERGYYWATRTIPIKKAFSYIPDNIYDNMDMDVDRMGYPLNRTAICATEGACPPLEPGKEANIMGIQGQSWAETIHTPDQLEYMVFPRLLALAERAWHKAGWESITDVNNRKIELNKDWEAFANTLGYKELRRLDKMGVKYRVPLVGAKKPDGSTVEVTSGFPGLQIQYAETSDTSTWKTLEGHSKTFDITSNVYFRTRSALGDRYSRTISVSVQASVSSAIRLSAQNPWMNVICFIVLLRSLLTNIL